MQQNPVPRGGQRQGQCAMCVLSCLLVILGMLLAHLFPSPHSLSSLYQTLLTFRSEPHSMQDWLKMMSEESRFAEEVLEETTSSEEQEVHDESKDKVSRLAIQHLRDNFVRVSSTLSNRFDHLQNAVFDLSEGKDRLAAEVVKLKKINKFLAIEVMELMKTNKVLDAEVVKLKNSNNIMRRQLQQQKEKKASLQKNVNDNEQYVRLWNLRIYGVKEAAGEEGAETVADCIRKCIEIFTNKVGVPVKEEDIEVAYRVGRPGTRRPRPIIVRFYSRQKKASVLALRRKLKNSGLTISEDLTKANHKLLKKASAHPATIAVWSSNGKILAHLKNGRTLKIDIDTDFKRTF